MWVAMLVMVWCIISTLPYNNDENHTLPHPILKVASVGLGYQSPSYPTLSISNKYHTIPYHSTQCCQNRIGLSTHSCYMRETTRETVWGQNYCGDSKGEHLGVEKTREGYEFGSKQPRFDHHTVSNIVSTTWVNGKCT